jgi:ABC-type glycerol-3-phosphate transport system substrate-binding protein
MRAHILLAAIFLIALSGCGKPDQPDTMTKSQGDNDRPAVPRPSVALRLVVVNDQPLAESIGRLRGEWTARSGGTLTTASVAWNDLISGETADADVTVFPSRYLGELCEKKWLRPVRENVLQNSAVDSLDWFSIVRQRLVVYDKQVMAVPLGIDLPVACYRKDHFNERRSLPRSWREYLAYVVAVEKSEVESASPITWEPTSRWAGVLLSIRAASYAGHADNPSLLFHLPTMAPQLTAPPFVRALENLRAVVGTVSRALQSDAERALEDPRAASWQIANGGAIFALGLPPSGQRGKEREGAKPQPLSGAERIGWTQIPGADEAYSFASHDWQKLDRVRHIPVLGAGDRLAAVTSSSRNAASAFQLLAWLAEPKVSTQFARAGGAVMPVRKSLASSPQWYDPQLSAAERAELAKVLEESLAGELCFIVPRIPGIDEYLAALDRAVNEVLVEKVEPAAALEKAAAAWEQITDRRGREAQRQAYLRHLGINLP